MRAMARRAARGVGQRGARHGPLHARAHLEFFGLSSGAEAKALLDETVGCPVVAGIHLGARRGKRLRGGHLVLDRAHLRFELRRGAGRRLLFGAGTIGWFQT